MVGDALAASNAAREEAAEWDAFFMEDLGGLVPRPEECDYSNYSNESDDDDDDDDDDDVETMATPLEDVARGSGDGVGSGSSSVATRAISGGGAAFTRHGDMAVVAALAAVAAAEAAAEAAAAAVTAAEVGVAAGGGGVVAGAIGAVTSSTIWSRLMRAPSMVMMLNDDGSIAPVPPDLPAVLKMQSTGHTHARKASGSGGGREGEGVDTTGSQDPASTRGGGGRRPLRPGGGNGGHQHRRTFSNVSFASSAGSADPTDCGDLLDMGGALGALGVLGVVDVDKDRDGRGGRKAEAKAGGDGDTSGGSLGRPDGSTSLTPTVAAVAAAKAAAMAGAANPPSEAAKKTAIRLKSGGWWELERALLRVVTLLIREMKPLGMEGMATFDPMAGIILWQGGLRSRWGLRFRVQVLRK